jgi:polysaccharide biosynthesis/export protein
MDNPGAKNYQTLAGNFVLIVLCVYVMGARGVGRALWGPMAARGILAVGALGLFALTAGCAMLPASGPSAMDVASEAASPTPEGGYVLFDIDERIVSISAAQPRESFRGVFHDVGPAPDLRIGVSDSVVVTIWEAGAGGLFSASANERSISAGSRTATIPEQVVARDGTIEVPYAGRLRVAGLRPGDVEQLVVRALQGKAIEPQAVVTISKNLSNTVTLGGEVVTGARVPLSTRGDRLLDVIAGAGGIRISAHEAFIRLTRRKHTVSVAYNTLLNHPEENIYVLPGDVVTVVRDPQTFTAFGATGRSEKIAFDTTGITLEETIAKAGGLNDNKADPSGVFLLRFEPVPLVAQFVPGYALPPGGNLVPVVYRLNLRDAHSFFLARSFAVKDKDILYIANSSSDQVQKFLGLVGLVTSPVISGAATYGAIK